MLRSCSGFKVQIFRVFTIKENMRRSISNLGACRTDLADRSEKK